MSANKTMKLRGTVLYLCEDEDLLGQQLRGKTLSTPPQDLRYGISTDLIIHGSACTKGYSENILGPHLLEYIHPQAEDGQISKSSVEVLVAGHAYGSGSSREVAVTAHRGAGINIVFAQSFQRIFLENMVFSGMLFSTDFSLLERLLNGEEISAAEIFAPLPKTYQKIALSGGLLRKDVERATAIPHGQAKTVIEKIIAKHQPSQPVYPGAQLECDIDFAGMHEYTAGMVMSLYEVAFGKAAISPILHARCFDDHFALIDTENTAPHIKAGRLSSANLLRQEMFDVAKTFNIPIDQKDGEKAGVCHRRILESYASPGQIIVMTDSHTPTAGAANTFAFGIGSTAMAYALRHKRIPLTVPHTLRIEILGQRQAALSTKDIMLHIIGMPFFVEEQWKKTAADTAAIQWGGAGLDEFGLDELSVLCNMTVEGGLMTGVIEPCAALKAQFRTWIEADEDAHYAHTMSIQLEDIPLTVASPGDPRNRKALHLLGDVPVHNVVIASCTGAALSDLRDAARVFQNNPQKVMTRLTITPASTEVLQKAEEEGLLKIFESAGALVTKPGCGACIGNGPGEPREGETTISTTNRNFDRRMGAPGPVYLSSPAVAAATALRGRLCDPRDLNK